jgi:hypothetical protein
MPNTPETVSHRWWEPLKLPIDLAVNLRLIGNGGNYVIERQTVMGDWRPETWSENSCGILLMLPFLNPRPTAEVEAMIMRLPISPSE